MPQDKITISLPAFPSVSAAVYGNGTETLLLLHGFPATGQLWRELVPLLADYRVIVPDVPGTGDSQPGKHPVSIQELAAAMISLLDHLQVDKAIIAGHSMGGYIALAMAALAPEKFKGLSLVHSTALADDEEKKANRRKAIALIEKGGKEAFIAANIPSLFPGSFKEKNPETIKQQVDEGMTVPAETLISFYNAMIERPDRTEVLQKAAFPVQWIMGEEDTVIPLQKGLQQSSLSGISFVAVYKGVGHMSMLEAPQRLAKDLSAFTVYCSNRKTKDLLR